VVLVTLQVIYSMLIAEFTGSWFDN